MAILVLLVGALLAVLVLVGRRPARVTRAARILRALFAAMAAVAAVVLALRFQWIASLVLVLLSTFMAASARPGPSPAPSPPSAGMSLAQARSILGVAEGAGRAEINAAYRRLMQRAHPDHGGSTGLAAQLNAARDILLR